MRSWASSATVLTLATVWAIGPARADDRVDFSTTWYQEKRRGASGLTVIHPQLDVGIDLGESTSLSAGYAADAVTGATAAVYSVDAVSSATEFDDLRHQGSLGIGFSGKRSSLTVTGGVASERDYLSLSVNVAASIDRIGKNTNLSLAYTHNFDEVCDRDNSMTTSSLERRALTGLDPCNKKSGLFGADAEGMTVWHELSIDTASGTVTQNITPTLVGQLTLYGQVLRGFQANPYRRVRVLGNEAQESVPDVRGRIAVTARINKYLEATSSALHATARGYSDTWGVNALSGELAYSQYAGSKLLFRGRMRVHQQSEATFFKDAFFYETEGPANAFFTGDRELAPVRNVLVGGKMSYIAAGENGKSVLGVFDEISFNIKADVHFFSELPANSQTENRAGTAGQFLSADQLLDAFVLQFGLAATY